MAGFKGQTREPRESARARRNSQNLSSAAQFVGGNSAISLDDTGTFQVNLLTGGGLENSAAALGIKLDTNPGLALSASGLTAVVRGVLTLDANGIGVTIGTGLQDDAGTLKTNDSQIVHDNLSGYVANEHVDHSTVSVIAGTGLAGGGDLTADRTLNVDEPNVNHNNLANYFADEHVDHATVSVFAGIGLTGGGDITTSRTIDLSAATTSVIGGVEKATAVADLNQTISSPPTQGEVQAISDKVDELLATMRAAGQLA